ncbi:T-complex protein 1 subunit theta [Tanacetum coccineum]|uniref:T-complex protein 1 subunit theta n=1 Tax=Tanacetum coccineum TaxID=301880 RepID=A0ABQ4YB38_9ASTR
MAEAEVLDGDMEARVAKLIHCDESMSRVLWLQRSWYGSFRLIRNLVQDVTAFPSIYINLSEIINGYKKASNRLGEIFEALVEEGSETMDVRNKDQVILRMKAPVSSKLYDMEDLLCPLIAGACIQVCPKNPVNFNVDNVRVAKLLGASPSASKTFRGMVLKVDTLVGSTKRIENAKMEEENVLSNARVVRDVAEELIGIIEGNVCISCLRKLKKAFILDKKLLKTCHAGSKIYLILEADAMVTKFHTIYDKLNHAINGFPYKEIGISEEVNEQVELMCTNKLVYKLFLNELVVQHPAAKLLVLAAKEQQKKFGDGANLVVSITGQHLEGAKELITMGLNPSQIINGYKKASNKLGEILEALVEEGSETMDVRNRDQVILRLKAPVSSKLYDMEDILCPLIADACIKVCPKNSVKFNVDNVRVAKLLGASPGASKTFRGMVLKVDTLVGSTKRIENAKVLVIAGGVDTTATETNLIHKLGNYAKTEETKVEELIKESGAKVIVSGAGVGQMALQFCNRNEIMVLKIASQFELDCFCCTTDVVPLLKLGSTLDPSYLGYVDSILVEETPGARMNNSKGLLLTLSILTRDSRIVPGAGATEIEIARLLKEFAFKETRSSDQIAIAKYAESFELIPKTLAQNAYLHVGGIIKTLYADHVAGNVKVGIDLKNEDCKDASTLNIWDLYTIKYQALQYAADAVCNALRVDQEPQSIFDCLMSPALDVSLSDTLMLRSDGEQRQYLLTQGRYCNIVWSGKVSSKDVKDTVLVGEHNLGIDVICIKKGQSDYDDVGKEVGKVRAVSDRNLNVLKVYGVESDQDFYKVSTEHCGRGLREFILSSRNDHKILLKLRRGIVTGFIGLHDKGIFLGNLDISDIFVDEHSNAKISVISEKSVFPLVTSSKGATGNYVNFADNMLLVGRIIFFSYTGVEYKGEDLTKPNSQEYLKPIYDSLEALDLLRKLLDKDSSKRPTAKEVYNHPLFWDPGMNLSFIRDVRARLRKEDPDSDLLIAIENIKPDVFVSRWDTYINGYFLKEMKKHCRYNYSLMRDLIRLIRNDATYNMERSGIETDLCTHFPELVIKLYNVMQKHCGEELPFKNIQYLSLFSNSERISVAKSTANDDLYMCAGRIYSHNRARWFQMLQKANEIPTWDMLASAIEEHFGPSQYDSPRAQLFKLTQTTSAADYYYQFTVMANRVEGLSPEALLDCFLSGLNDHIRRDVIAQDPKSLIRAGNLSRLFDEIPKFASPSTLPKTSIINSSTSTTFLSPPPMQSTLPSLLPKPQTKPLQPIKKLSPAEMQLPRQEKGLCFTCDDKFTWNHKCPNKQMLLMTSTDEPAQPDVNSLPQETTEPHLSINAYHGSNGMATILLFGSINGTTVQVLLDGGSSDNFIQPRVAKHVSLPIEPSKTFRVMVRSGTCWI